MSFSARSLAATAALSLTAMMGSGCELLSVFEGEGTTLVQLMVTHHATPQDGMFPDLSDGEGRTFETDDGWVVRLGAGYVTTAHAELENCNGEVIAFDPFWGPLPESFGDEDLDLLSFAGVEVAAGSYCTLTVDYGPFDPAEGEGDRYQMGEDGEKVRGATYYFRGTATKDGVEIPFELVGNDRMSVELDLAHVENGSVLTIDAEEAFPIDLTLSKTYDQLFDGLDFSSLDPEDTNASIMAMLELETRIAFGTRVSVSQ